MKCMAEDAPTQAKLGSGRTIIDALEEFTAKTHQTLRDIGRTPLVWQEMVLDYGDIGINKNTIVDIWVNSRDVRAVLDKGYRIIHASADYFYLVSTLSSFLTAGLWSRWLDSRARGWKLVV